MTKSQSKYLSTLLFTTFLLILFAGCMQQKPNSASGGLKTEHDSILLWIEGSNASQLSTAEREGLLNKALEMVENLPDDSLKLEYSSQISLNYLRKNDSLKFRNATKKTMALAKKLGDSIRLAEAHWDLATFFGKQAIPDSTFYHYGEAHTLFETMGNKLLSGRMLYNMATTQADIKDYIGSESNTIKAIELLKPLEAYRYLYLCYNNLGVVSKEIGAYERARDYYGQALEYAQKSGEDPSLESGIYNNIGNVYQQQEQHKKAKEFYQKALENRNLRQLNPGSYARILANLAHSRMKTGDISMVEDQLLTALKIRDSLSDYEGMSINHYLLADYYQTEGNTKKAYTSAQKALDYSGQIDNNKRLLLTYQLLTKIDPANATTYSDAYIRLNDSIQLQERQIRDKFARIQFETDEFIAENVLLARQRQLWIGVAAGVLLLAIALFIIIYQRVKNQRLRFEQQQQKTNQEIFDLMLTTNQKVEEGKHDEQKRISEELHDGVLGQMNGVRMVLLGLNKKSDDTAINMRSQAIEKLQEVQEEIRTISHELSDAAYQKFHNFMISIRDLVETIGQASQIECEFTYDHDTDWDDLSGEIKINLYRIIQEGLQNCVKYSEASLIKLNFDSDRSYITVGLEDNGVGFESKKVKKGIGHKNINSRVSKMKGTWELESSPGQGTKIVIKVPVVRSAHHTVSNEDQVMEEETIE
ncbi:MAG: sensor histidine kinase [Flavobacteriaceae bacterium]